MSFEEYDDASQESMRGSKTDRYPNQSYTNKKYAHVKSKVHDLIHAETPSRNRISDWSPDPQEDEPRVPSPVYTIPLDEVPKDVVQSSRDQSVNRTFSLDNAMTIPSKTRKEKKEKKKQEKKEKKKKKEENTRPWFTWIISAIHILYFIAEIIYNGVLTHLPIDTTLSRNPLIGPSPFILINMGASFSPCMHTISGITDNISSTLFPCPNNTLTGCTLSQLCGFNGVTAVPNQWFRLFLPIFLHAGIVHIVFNLISQIMLVGDIEKKIGPIRVIFIYFTSGIFGFVLGGNFGPNGTPRVGCSGSVFSIFALSVLDIFYNWKKIEKPVLQLIVFIITFVINIVLGLLPGVDNFSHVGGFVLGLLLGIAIMGSPSNIRRFKSKKIPGRPRTNKRELGCCKRFFYNRPTSWWVWWVVRFFTFAAAVTLFAVFTENFYSRRISCDGCKYISCLPVNGWCDMGTLNSNG